MSKKENTKMSIFEQVPKTPNVNFDIRQFDFYFSDKFHIGFSKIEVSNEPIPYEPTYKALIKANGFYESNSGAGTYGEFTNEKYSEKLNNSIKLFKQLKKMDNKLKNQPKKENEVKENGTTNQPTTTTNQPTTTTTKE